MIIPKVISICGKPHKVSINPKHNGGWFDEAKAEIGIGTACKEDVPEILLHEVIESTLAVRNHRYALERAEPENGDLIFSFSHENLEQVCKDLAASFKGIRF